MVNRAKEKETVVLKDLSRTAYYFALPARREVFRLLSAEGVDF
jgi:hypothetical protein